MVCDSLTTRVSHSDLATGVVESKLRPNILRGLQNASYLALGNVVSQAVGFVGFAFIAKLLGPTDYGIYVTVGAFVGMFDVLMLRGLDKVVIREGSRDIASMHLALEKTVAVRNVLTACAVIVCAVTSWFTPYTLQIKLYIMLFSLHLVYGGLNGFLGTIYQASQKMQYIAVLSIANRVLCVCASVAYLYLAGRLLGLFVILLVSNLIILAATYKKSREIVRFRFFTAMKFDPRLLKPAVVFSLVGFLGFFISRIDLLMISFLGEAKDVGVYGVAYKIAHEGEMLRNICAVAFFPILVKRFDQGAIQGRTLIKYSVFFLGGIVLLSAVASFFAGSAIETLFGDKYTESGPILSVLVYYLAFAWATLPFSVTLQATHNERHLIIPALIMAGLNVVLNYVCFQHYGILGIAYATLVVQFTGWVLLCLMTVTILKRQRCLV